MDLSIVFILLTGLGLGLAHSLDPDHIVAVSTLLCNNKSIRKSLVSATVWGIGHSAVLFTVGILLLIFRVEIPQSVVNLFEGAAGVLLIILGVYVITPLINDKLGLIHRESHSYQHTHPHSHSHPHEHTHEHQSEHQHLHIHKSAITGALQGLGGSAALMLVTLATVSSVEVGLAFIFIFGLGVIFGMVSISCLVGKVVAYAANNLARLHTIIKVVTGSISIGFGIFIVLNVLFLHISW
jgi:ABC-type nickel/cobalt efflux system permease component RcnA